MRYRIYLNTIVYEVFVVPYSGKHGPEYLPFGAVLLLAGKSKFSSSLNQLNYVRRDKSDF